MRYSKLLASALLPFALGVPANAAFAQTPTSIEQSKRNFEIPAQDLASALNAWGKQADIQVLFPYDSVVGRRSAPVSGRMTPSQALQQLMENQPLSVASTSATTIALKSNLAKSSALSETEVAERVVEEIIVTAQRRPEAQRKVPIAMSAFGEEEIGRLRIQTLQDLSRSTPGLLVSSFSPGKPVIAIRGATNTFSQIGVDKPVGVFVDDVYIPRSSAATIELFGINSLQVLKGPQGTLFGRNVTGGAIIIDTGKPNFEASKGSLRATAAERQTLEADAQIDLPVGENMAIRVAGMVRQNDGWGFDRLSGQQLDDQDSSALRAQFRWVPSDTVELLLAADTAKDASGGRTLSSIGVGDDGNRRTAETGLPQGFDRESTGVSGRLFWRSNLGEMTSITAYRASKTTDIFSNVGANFRFLSGTQSQALTDDRDDVATVSQEVRFTSKLWDRGSFILGAYFAQEEAERDLLSTALAAGTGNLVTNQRALQNVDSTTTALFADATLNLSDIWTFTLGGRFTADEKTASLVRTNALQPATNFTARDLKAKWEEFTPRVVLKAQPVSNAMLYASYSRGYTAGGFNTEAATVAALTTPFSPETVDNYEFGMKSSWLQNRLRFNVSFFQASYEDKQELFFNNLTRVLNITNAASASMRGIEMDVKYKMNSWLSLSASYGYLDTRYDDFIIPGGANNTGNDLGSSPRNKVSLSLDLDHTIKNTRVFGNLSASSTSGYYTGAARDPNLFVPSYQLINGQLGISILNGKLDLAIYGRNLLDEEYILIPSVQVVRAQYLGQPRSIGLTLTTRY